MYYPMYSHYRFINDLLYTSDEMVLVEFPDERYNKHKLITTRRDEIEMLHVWMITAVWLTY